MYSPWAVDMSFLSAHTERSFYSGSAAGTRVAQAEFERHGVTLVSVETWLDAPHVHKMNEGAHNGRSKDLREPFLWCHGSENRYYQSDPTGGEKSEAPGPSQTIIYISYKIFSQ